MSLSWEACALLGTSTNLVIKEISADHVNIEMFTMLPLGVVCSVVGFSIIIIIYIFRTSTGAKRSHKDDTHPLSRVGAYALKLKFQVAFELVESDEIKNTNTQSLFVEI